MKTEERTIDTDKLMEFYRNLLPEVDTLPLRITGSSMAPFLVGGRDTVHLSKVDRPLKVGDMVLYQRRSGAYILHRICRIRDGEYWMAGDAHAVREPGIRPEQIFGLVRRVERKNIRLEPGCICWDFFEKIWVRLVPVRPALLRLYGGLRKVFGGK